MLDAASQKLYSGLGSFWHQRIGNLADDIASGVDPYNPSMGSNARHWADRSDYDRAVRLANQLVQGGYVDSPDSMRGALSYLAGQSEAPTAMSGPSQSQIDYFGQQLSTLDPWWVGSIPTAIRYLGSEDANFYDSELNAAPETERAKKIFQEMVDAGITYDMLQGQGGGTDLYRQLLQPATSKWFPDSGSQQGLPDAPPPPEAAPKADPFMPSLTNTGGGDGTYYGFAEPGESPNVAAGPGDVVDEVSFIRLMHQVGMDGLENWVANGYIQGFTEPAWTRYVQNYYKARGETPPDPGDDNYNYNQSMQNFRDYYKPDAVEDYFDQKNQGNADFWGSPTRGENANAGSVPTQSPPPGYETPPSVSEPAFGPTAGGQYTDPNSKGLSAFDQNKAKLVAARMMGTRDDPFWGSRGDGAYWGLGYIDRNYNNPTQRKQFMQAVADNMHNYMQGEKPAYNTSTPEGKAAQEAYFANLNDPRSLIERLDYWMDGWEGGYTTEKGSAERDEYGQWKPSTFSDLRDALMQYDTQYKYGTPDAQGATYFSGSYGGSQQPSDPFAPTGGTITGTGGGIRPPTTGGYTPQQPVYNQPPTYTPPTGQGGTAGGSDPFWNVQFNPTSRANDFYTEQFRRLQRQRNAMREANLGRDWATGHLAEPGDPFTPPVATQPPAQPPVQEPPVQPPIDPAPQPPVQPGDNTGSNDAPDFGAGAPGTGTGDVIINNPPPVYTQPSDPFQPPMTTPPPTMQPTQPTDPFVPPPTGGGGSGSTAGGVTPDLQRMAAPTTLNQTQMAALMRLAPAAQV